MLENEYSNNNTTSTSAVELSNGIDYRNGDTSNLSLFDWQFKDYDFDTDTTGKKYL